MLVLVLVLVLVVGGGCGDAMDQLHSGGSKRANKILSDAHST